MMFITKWEWSYSSWTAFPVSISIFLADIIVVPGGSEDLSTSDVPLFWTTLGLVLGDHNEAGSLGFWSAHKEKRILRLSSSAAVITHQQNNNLDCHRTADDQTFDLSFQSSAGRIDLEADGYLCNISQFGHETAQRRIKSNMFRPQPQHWLQLLHTLQIHILKYTNYL